MAQKKIPYLKLVEPPEDIREVRKKGRKIKRKKAEKIATEKECRKKSQ